MLNIWTSSSFILLSTWDKADFHHPIPGFINGQDCSLQVQSFCCSPIQDLHMQMCTNWVIVHANRWLNRQLSNLHEQMEVVPIQKARGTWTLCKQADGLKACGNLTLGPHSCLNPRASWGLKLHKWNFLFDLSCHGNDQISNKVIFRKYHGKGFDFYNFFSNTIYEAEI